MRNSPSDWVGVSSIKLLCACLAPGAAISHPPASFCSTKPTLLQMLPSASSMPFTLCVIGCFPIFCWREDTHSGSLQGQGPEKTRPIFEENRLLCIVLFRNEYSDKVALGKDRRSDKKRRRYDRAYAWFPLEDVIYRRLKWWSPALSVRQRASFRDGSVLSRTTLQHSYDCTHMPPATPPLHQLSSYFSFTHALLGSADLVSRM